MQTSPQQNTTQLQTRLYQLLSRLGYTVCAMYMYIRTKVDLVGSHRRWVTDRTQFTLFRWIQKNSTCTAQLVHNFHGCSHALSKVITPNLKWFLAQAPVYKVNRSKFACNLFLSYCQLLLRIFIGRRDSREAKKTVKTNFSKQMRRNCGYEKSI